MRPLTRSCFLLLFLGRLLLLSLPFLLGTCLSSLWSPPFLFHTLALILHFLAKIRLSITLTLSPLMIWHSGQTALFPFLLERAAPAFLPTALSVALRPLFPFLAGPVYSSFSAEACGNLLALSWSWQHQQICHLSSLLFCYYLYYLVLSSPPYPLLHLSSYLKFSRRSGRNCLLSPSALLGCNGYPDTRFSRGTTRLMSWSYGEHYFSPQQSLVVSLLLSFIFTLVFSRTGGVLSHLNFLTYRFLQFPPRNLCVLVMLAVFSLIFAATDTQPSFRLLSL